MGKGRDTARACAGLCAERDLWRDTQQAPAAAEQGVEGHAVASLLSTCL